MKKSNEETILMIQIESPIGVENVGQILDVEGIDAAFIGPNDLSQSMGIMGQTNHPMFIEAVEKVIWAAKERNKFSGIHMMSTEALKTWIDKGMTLNLWANEIVMMMNTAKEGIAQIKCKEKLEKVG
jgi:2-dehydro-3-deoxyglucarate aldolase/4-hydroxy-2-oxoheptanedioate aldolase